MITNESLDELILRHLGNGRVEGRIRQPWDHWRKPLQVFRGLQLYQRIGVMARRSRYSPEVKARAVRMVFDQQAQHESQWSAISSIASKIGCTGETLRTWVRQAERDAGKRAGLTTGRASAAEGVRARGP